MARYYERAENNARLIDVNQNMMLDMGRALANSGATASYWNPIVRMISPFDEFRARFPRTTADAAIEWLTFSRDNPNSIVTCIARARENARAIRPALSSEMWEQVNTTYWTFKNTSMESIKREGQSAFFQRIRESSQLFQGMVKSTFPNDEGFYWLELGQHLERADATSRLVDVKYYILLPSLDEVGGPIDQTQWAAVLKSCSAYEAYQRKYVAKITPSRVAEFLVLHPAFPALGAVLLRQDPLVAAHHLDRAWLLGRWPELVASQVRHMLTEASMTGIIQLDCTST
jgi:uncharacterized alpha-E superfamily protein